MPAAPTTPTRLTGPPNAPFFDADGLISKPWMWYLYQIFTTTASAFELQVLEAFNRDDNPDLSRTFDALSLSTVAADGATVQQLEEVRALLGLDAAPVVGSPQIDEARGLIELAAVESLLPRLLDLEKLVAMLTDQTPPAAAAPLLFTNAGKATGGVANNGSGIPTTQDFVTPGVPSVTALPGVGDPLSFIGSMVIYHNKPYVFTAGLAGPPGFWKQSVASATTLSGTRAARAGFPAANYPQGSLYYETDSTLSYMVQFPAGTATWIYYNGIYQAPLASLPGGLGVNDINYTFRASDYLHSWVWNGSAWHFAAGEQGFYPAGSYGIFNPGQVPFGLWGLSDGSTYAVAQDNATTANVVTPVVTNQYLRR